MKTFLALLSLLLAIATTTLAAPVELGGTTDLHRHKRSLHPVRVRQTDNFKTAVAGPPGAAELGLIFGALVAAWALVAVAVLLLRKRRQDFMTSRQRTQEIKDRWEDTDRDSAHS